MLHELLFALIGKPGNLIRLLQTGLQLDPSVSMISESQKQLLNGMCLAGTHFRAIQAFIEDTVSSWTLPPKLPAGPQDQDQPESNRSAYRKSLCYGLNEVMDSYKSVILGIEQLYINNRFFTYANIQAQLNVYLVLLPKLTELITKIMQDDIKGGQLLELLSAELEGCNMWVREAYSTLFKECYKVLYNQLAGWILYGKLLDSHHEFFIHKIQSVGSKDLQKDWDSLFTLELSMLPTSLVSKSTAEKILFIGKSIRILRYINKEQSLLPPQKLVAAVKELQNFESFRFDAVVEKIRYDIAHQLMELIMQRENLLGQLEQLKRYYLMSKGQFFHIFLEQAQPILSLPHDKKNEQYLNTLHLQTTMIRLNQQPNPRLSFELKQNGFNFKNFGSLSNLNVIGNVSLKPNNFLRFQPVKNYGGSLWYNMKQNIDNSFNVKFTVRFKRLHNQSALNATQLTELTSRDGESSSTSICYVFQNCNEISSWRKDAPISLSDLKQYLCVRVTVMEGTKRSESRSKLSVHYLNPKIPEEECLGQLMLLDRKQNFAEEDFHQLKISYLNGEQLRVVVDDFQSADNSLTLPLGLGKLLNLDMGRAFMGFLQHSQNSSHAVDLISWEMAASSSYNLSSDYWSDLTINYEIREPLKLILSNQLLEKYKQIFKLLFPVRQAQIDLDRMWLRLQRMLKSCSRREERLLVRRISMFRNQLSMTINSLWSFLQSDVVETQWCRLTENISKTDDFEKLRMYLDLYIKSVSNMCFLSTPRILKSVFGVVKYCKDFVILCNRLYRDGAIQPHSRVFYELEQSYKEAFRVFTGQLKTASKNTTSSNHLYQLLLRLDYNGFYQARGMQPQMVE